MHVGLPNARVSPYRAGLVLLTVLGAGLASVAQAAAPDDPHQGPAPLEPYPAGSLESHAVSYSMMLFHLREPREDPARALAEIARKNIPELRIGATESTAPSSGPRLLAGTVEIQPPDRESIATGSHAVASEDQEALRRCRSAFTMNVVAGSTGWLPRLRRIQRAVHELATRTGALIWDPQARELFTPASFARRRSGGWAGDRPVVSRHISVRRPRSGDEDRMTTRGLAAFGLPDILVAGASVEEPARAEGLLLLAADAVLGEPKLERTGELVLRPSRCRDADVRARVDRNRMQQPLRAVVRVGERRAVDRNRLMELTPVTGWSELLRWFRPAGSVR